MARSRIALATGFTLAAMSSPVGRYLLRFAVKSATAAAGAYISKRGIDFVTNKIVQR